MVIWTNPEIIETCEGYLELNVYIYKQNKAAPPVEKVSL